MFHAHSISIQLADACWKATLLLAAAAVLARFGRFRTASSRHLVWLVSLASLLILPLASQLGFSVQLPSPAAPLAAGVLGTIQASVAAGVEGVRWLPVIWAAGALVCLAGLLAGITRSWWIARRAVACETSFSDAEVRESGAVHVPVILGWVRPVIVLPLEARQWPSDLIGLTLLHELAHWRRQDCRTRILEELVRCLYWFHPLVWYAIRWSRLEAEMACDDAVMASGVRASDYAGHLLAVAKGIQRTRGFQAAPAMVGSANLESRVRAILDWRPGRPAWSARRVAVLAVGSLVAVVLLGLVQPRFLLTASAQSSQQRKPAQDAQIHRIGEEGLTPPRLTFKIEPAYTEDARAAKISGTTTLSLDIDPDGVPHNVFVVVSLDPGLDENAIAAIRQWRFEPGTLNGQPVWVTARVEVNFRLQ